jgi:hypothetical protein
MGRQSLNHKAIPLPSLPSPRPPELPANEPSKASIRSQSDAIFDPPCDFATTARRVDERASAEFRNGRKSFRDRDVITTTANLFFAPVPCLLALAPSLTLAGPRVLLQTPQGTNPARDRWIEVRNPMSSPPLTPRERDHIFVGELNKQQQQSQ